MDMNYDVRVTLMHFATSKFNIETIKMFRKSRSTNNFKLLADLIFFQI